MTGPLTLTQPGEHGARLPFTHPFAAANREQVLAVVTTGELPVTVLAQQRTHLVGQRQRVLDPGFGVLGRNVPLTLGQAEVRPLRHTRLAYSGAVAQHQ
ncbi:hypothetical protein D3C79_920640 [compost metagenome]